MRTKTPIDFSINESLRESKVLLIVEDLIIANDLKRIIKQITSNVILTSNYSEAIKIAKSYHPELILCDFSLGKESGNDFIAELKKTMRFHFMYIISYTNTEVSQKHSELTLGNFILKPFQERQIKVSVKFALAEFKKQSVIWDELNLSLLTKKELEVLKEIYLGKQSKEIAKFLNLSAKTIESHRSNISNKLILAPNKTGLIQWILENNAVINYFFN